MTGDVAVASNRVGGVDFGRLVEQSLRASGGGSVQGSLRLVLGLRTARNIDRA